VAAGEAGGITQHIGAYHVDTKNGVGDIVFLDTPGHAGLHAMRARGAQATDIVVLVVAADDGVMPQTVEAINTPRRPRCRSSSPSTRSTRKARDPTTRPTGAVRQGLQPEEWGGDTLFVDVSAITGQGIDEPAREHLAPVRDPRAHRQPGRAGRRRRPRVHLDKGRGPVATVLIRNGTMHQGDYVLAGAAMGKVRALTDENGQRLKEAGPATPVEILGLSDVSGAGEQVYVVADEAAAKEIAEQRRLSAEAKAKAARRLTMADVQDKLRRGDVRELNLIIKSDVQGSNEALTKALLELSTEKVEVKVIHSGVGGITENDVMLASASSAIIIGFNVRPAGKAGATAKNEGIDIRTYRVIYDAVDDVRKAMTGLLEPEYQAEDVGKAEVRATFGIPKIGTIAGCYVTDGKILRNGKARLVRDSTLIWEGDIASLRRFKDDVREVAMGYECGIGLANFSDIKEGDIIECYQMVEIEVTL
jgi:translation initiation factor IF-2